jgi:hypothetical protein
VGAIELEAGGWLALVPQVRFLFTVFKAKHGALAQDDAGCVAWIAGQIWEIWWKRIMISMVVVNYNAGSLLAKCVQAALPQVSEILVVDIASSDSRIEVCARQFADEPRLRILHNETNLGFATACNIDFKGGTGEFVLFSNPDCRLDWSGFGRAGMDRAHQSRCVCRTALVGSPVGGGRI